MFLLVYKIKVLKVFKSGFFFDVNKFVILIYIFNYVKGFNYILKLCFYVIKEII